MEQDQWVQAPAPAERASRVDVAVRAEAARVAADVGLAVALVLNAQCAPELQPLEQSV